MTDAHANGSFHAEVVLSAENSSSWEAVSMENNHLIIDVYSATFELSW